MANLKVLSINVNGLRAYNNKGALQELIDAFDPDILCLQETKCSADQVKELFHPDYYVVEACSNTLKGGYAGVATIIKKSCMKDHEFLCSDPIDIKDDNDPNFNYYSQGRIIDTQVDGFHIYNCYVMNSGGKEDYRQQWNKGFRDMIRMNQEFDHMPIIICGDLNVVAGEKDYWKDYESAIDSGPGLYQFEINDFHERQKQFGLVDSYRQLHPDGNDYSWYSYRFAARKRNHGWRIDYFLVSDELMPFIEDSKVYSSFEGSDHNPIELVLKDQE